VARAEALLAAITLAGVSGGLMVAMGGHEESDRAAARGVRSKAVKWPPGAHPAPSFSLGDQDGRQASPGGKHRRSALVIFLRRAASSAAPLGGSSAKSGG
jgi:hypothetical protein